MYVSHFADNKFRTLIRFALHLFTIKCQNVNPVVFRKISVFKLNYLHTYLCTYMFTCIVYMYVFTALSFIQVYV